MQGKLRKILRDHRHHTGVVRTRRDLAEDHLIPLHEEFNAKDATATQRLGNLTGNLASLGLGLRTHHLRLPRFTIVSIDLYMADRLQEGGSTDVAHGQLGDLVIEINKSLDNHLSSSGTSPLLCIMPGRFDIFRLANHTLAMATGAHDRFHHTGHANHFDSLLEFSFRSSKAIGRGRQAQFFGSQPTDTLAVHRQPSGTCGRNHMIALLLQLHQGGGGNGLYFGHNVIRLLLFDDGPQCCSIQHRNNIRAMGYLHGRCIRIFIQRDDLYAITL